MSTKLGSTDPRALQSAPSRRSHRPSVRRMATAASVLAGFVGAAVMVAPAPAQAAHACRVAVLVSRTGGGWVSYSCPGHTGHTTYYRAVAECTRIGTETRVTRYGTWQAVSPSSTGPWSTAYCPSSYNPTHHWLDWQLA